MIRLILVSVFLVYFQYFFSIDLGIASTVPNFLLPIVIYFNSTKNNITGLISGFIFGVILDINSPHTFGSTTLLFVTIAFFFGNIKSKINREQKGFMLFLIFLTNLFYFLFSNLLFVIFQPNVSISIFKILLLIFYNSIYSIIIILFLFLIDNLQITIKKAR